MVVEGAGGRGAAADETRRGGPLRRGAQEAKKPRLVRSTHSINYDGESARGGRPINHAVGLPGG
jgi:hypothetical protein